LRADGGIRRRTSAEIRSAKHQHVEAPSAMAQSFSPPHSGQRAGELSTACSFILFP